MTPETLPTAASAEHLTNALRRSGALGDGRVSNVVVESSRPTILSRIIRLRLTYDGAAADAPSSVILKTGLPERTGSAWNGGRQEVAFYTKVASELPPRLVPRCFEAFCDTDTNGWHLLLEDLADSHAVATVWPLPPTTQQCEMILQTLARFHAAWWDDPLLGISVGTWLDADAIDRHLNDLAEQFRLFSDRIGDRLPRERRELFERVLDAGPRLVARYHSHRNITVVHGDAHVWNCFLPRHAGGVDVRLFDWDSWRINVGSSDLSYMMAMHWYPDRRGRIERQLLDRYHEALVAHGVRGYDRRALQDDYRLSVLWQIATPVWQAAYDIPPVIWWNNLERILLAFDDLGCRDLLGP
jgi:Ecdysteroid kinase-like family